MLRGERLGQLEFCGQPDALDVGAVALLVRTIFVYYVAPIKAMERDGRGTGRC
jgi:hypothetical protein